MFISSRNTRTDRPRITSGEKSVHPVAQSSRPVKGNITGSNYAGLHASWWQGWNTKAVSKPGFMQTCYCPFGQDSHGLVTPVWSIWSSWISYTVSARLYAWHFTYIAWPWTVIVSRYMDIRWVNTSHLPLIRAFRPGTVWLYNQCFWGCIVLLKKEDLFSQSLVSYHPDRSPRCLTFSLQWAAGWVGPGSRSRSLKSQLPRACRARRHHPFAGADFPGAPWGHWTGRWADPGCRSLTAHLAGQRACALALSTPFLGLLCWGFGGHLYFFFSLPFLNLSSSCSSVHGRFWVSQRSISIDRRGPTARQGLQIQPRNWAKLIRMVSRHPLAAPITRLWAAWIWISERSGIMWIRVLFFYLFNFYFFFNTETV